MGKFLKFIIALILVCIILGIVYAYMNIEEVIEYRENKNVNQNEIKYNIINLEIENKIENRKENRLENLIENNIIENKNLENVVENIMENIVNN